MDRRAQGQRSIRVLIMEDNPVDADLCARKLTEAGFIFTLATARTGAEFRRLVADQSYDLVIGDYNLPDWNGLEAVRWLRSCGIVIPFVLVTGSLGDELAIECIRAGADDYILKDRLDRLPLAVQKVLLEQQLRIERDWAEKELRESEHNYRLLFNSNPEPMWVFDAETLRFLAVNDAAVRHYGYSAREFLTMSVLDIRPPEEAARITSKVKDGTLATVERFRELYIHKKKDGTLIDMEISAQPIAFRAVKAMLVVAIDVTEHRKLEQQFRYAQKMEAIGRLAGGVAHDFNNLLMVISSNAELIREHLDQVERVGRYLGHIGNAVDRAAVLTKQLLAFGRKQVQDLSVLNLNQLLPEFASLLPSLLGEDIELILKTSPHECLVYCDKSQIEQVVMNLVVNARDAMPEGGKLIIELDRFTLGEAYFVTHGVEAQPGEYVMLAVTDTGTGMDEAVQQKAFEPFFTTKEPGKGTGLGLSTVYGIVKQNGGYTWLYSEPGVGTIFKIYLPYAQERAVATETPEPLEHSQGAEHGTILLVEDQAALRAGISEYLEGRGYRVLQAAGGADALAMVAAQSTEIDLLLTDLIMPGLSGRELASNLVKSRPGIAVVYMSGYTEQAVNPDAFEKPHFYIQKPFTLTALAGVIRRALDNRNAPEMSVP